MTLSFPYKDLELFLSSELWALSNHFSAISLIPKEIDQTHDKNLPNNVEVKHLFKSEGAYRNAYLLFELSIIQEFFSLFFTKNVFLKFKVFISQALMALKVLRSLEKEITINEDLIFYSYWLNENAIALAMMKKKYPQCTYISRAHGWDVYFERHRIKYLPYRPFLSKNLDRIFFISENGLNYFKQIARIDKEKLQLSRLGSFNKTSWFEINKLQAIETPLKIVSCSSLIPLKRVHLMIEAFALLKFPFHWYHIGVGPLQEEIASLANEKLKKEQYSFLGLMKNEDVKRFYSENSIHLFINTSSTEGIPVSMMEALSFGIPCVGTSVGGVGELIKNNLNGYLLVANPSPQLIASCLQKHVELSNEAKKNMSKSAYDFWSKSFNAENNYKTFIQTISNL